MRNLRGMGKGDGARADLGDGAVDGGRRVSRFRRDRALLGSGLGGTAGGLPSLDVPLGTFARTTARAHAPAHSAAVIHHLTYMDDAVPPPPPSDCYRPASNVVRPVWPFPKSADTSVGRAAAGAIYATEYSVEGAESDGVAYYSNPPWNFLSRMRLVPALASVVGSCTSSSSCRSTDEGRWGEGRRTRGQCCRRRARSSAP